MGIDRRSILVEEAMDFSNLFRWNLSFLVYHVPLWCVPSRKFMDNLMALLLISLCLGGIEQGIFVFSLFEFEEFEMLVYGSMNC